MVNAKKWKLVLFFKFVYDNYFDSFTCTPMKITFLLHFQKKILAYSKFARLKPEWRKTNFDVLAKNSIDTEFFIKQYMIKHITSSILFLLLCSFSTYAQNKIDDDFIEVSSSNLEEQIKEIKAHIGETFDSIQKQNKLRSEYQFIQQENEKWLRQKAGDKFEWFATLKEKESNFLKYLEEYKELNRQIQRLRDEREIASDEIDHFDTKIDHENKKLEIIDTIISQRLKEELLSKLATIPQSIVLVGRIRSESGVSGSRLSEALFEKMQDHAIEKINGANYLNKIVNANGEVLELGEKTIRGRAEFADNYYKDLRRIPNDVLVESYQYKILRIEVYPFDRKKNKKSAQSTNSIKVFNQKELDTLRNLDIDIFEVRNKSLYNIVDNAMSPYAIHKFSKQEIDYIIKQKGLSNELNNSTYLSQINKTADNFNRKLEEKRKEREKILEEIKLQEGHKAKKQQKLEILKANLENLEQIDIYQKKKDYEQAKLEYENHYESKYSLTNKLTIKREDDSAEEISSLRDIFVSLIDENFKVVTDPRENISETTIYKVFNEEVDSLFYKKEVINIKPQLEAFKILSLNIYVPEEENSPLSYIALNVAYKIKGKVVSPMIFEDSCDCIVDSEYHLQWKVTNDLISYRSRNAPEGYRLPTAKELTRFFDEVEVARQNDKDIFGERFNWPEADEGVVFLTQDSKLDDQNNRQFKVLAMKGELGYQYESNYIDAYEEAYAIYVKDE